MELELENLQLIAAIVSQQATACRELTWSDKGDESMQLYAHIKANALEDDAPKLLHKLQCELAIIATAMTVEGYEGHFHVFGYGQETLSRISQTIREAFPTAVIRVLNSVNNFWYVFVPAAAGEQAQQTINELVGRQGSWFTYFQGEQVQGKYQSDRWSVIA